jgi:hypothetical protein
MIEFQCPKCHKRLRADESKAGKPCVCPACQTRFPIPAAAADDDIIEDVVTVERPSKAKPRRDPDARVVEEPVRRRRPADDEEEPVRRRRPADEDDDGPVRKRRPLDEDEDEDEFPRRRRRDEDEEDEEEERPRRRKKKKRRHKSFELPLGMDAFTAGLLGVGVFGLLFVPLALFSPVIAVVPYGMGTCMCLGGWIWLVVIAFQDETQHGVLCLCCSPYCIYYIATHFEDAKRPFFVWLTGFVLQMAGGLANPELLMR